MSGAELKQCPFCGGTELYWPHGTDPAIIECGGNGCGARSGVPEEQQESEAVALWNRRTPDPAQIRADALREAAARVAKMRILYQIECGRYDPTTGVTEYPGTGEEWISDMEDIEESILALIDAPLSPTAVDNSPAPDAGGKEGV